MTGGWAGKRRCRERVLWSLRDVCRGIGMVDGRIGIGNRSHESKWAVHVCTSERIVLVTMT